MTRQRKAPRSRRRQPERTIGAGWQIAVFWASLTLLGTFLYWRLFAMYAELPPSRREGSDGLTLYRHAGEALLRGELPYRDFFIEYPPGSLLAFVIPALFSSDRVVYTQLFAMEMALALIAALILTALTARRIWGQWAYIVPAVTYTLAAILLYNFVLARYDAVVTLTLAVSSFCVAHGGRYVLLAYASLGFGAAAKLVPALATLPLALVRRKAFQGYAIFFIALVLFFVPPLLLAGEGFVESFAYHANRGLQVESLLASILTTLGWANHIVFEYGAFEVQGRGVELASSLTLPVTASMLLFTSLVMYRAYRSGRLGIEQYPRYAAALVLAYLLGSKVLSPQFMLWLLPLVPLAARGTRGFVISAIFLAACGATRLLITYYQDLLAFRFPGPELVLGRNLLLLLLWALLLFLPERPSSQAER